MTKFFTGILVGGPWFLLTVVTAFVPDDLAIIPFSESGWKLIKQNTRVTVQCTAAKDGNVSFTLDRPNFKWTAAPMPIVNERGKVIAWRQSTATGTIDSFGPSDVGTYTCQVYIHGKLVGERSVILEMDQGTTQTSVLSHVGAESVQLHCAAMHDVEGVAITWLNAHGTEINAASSSMFPRYTVQGPNLAIHQVELSDAGPYTCNVAQTIGNANVDGNDATSTDSERVTIHLHVEHVPYFVHPEVEVQRDTKNAITLTCDAVTGVPMELKPPIFSWDRNGVNMSEKDGDTFPTCRERQCIVPFDDNHSLYDSITCSADNGLGVAEKLFSIVEGVRQTAEIDVSTGRPMLTQVTRAIPTPRAASGASAVKGGLSVHVLIGALCLAFFREAVG